MIKVAYVGGYWASNIGNAFFNIGADYFLKKIFKEENVKIIMDQPGYVQSFSKKKTNPKNSVNLIENLDVDYVVLLGPVLSRAFLHIWKKTIIKLKEKGIGYMLLSAGMMKCSDKDIKEIKEFFKEYPPYVLMSRETKTYETFKDCVKYSYDGVCFAFFVPDAYTPQKYNMDKPIVLNFDKMFEPKITINEKKYDFIFEGEKWNLKFNSILKRVGGKTDRISDLLVYLLSYFPRGRRKNEFLGHPIIRTDHRFLPMFKKKVYRYGNSFAGDCPQTYLDIYSMSRLTLSDRVHACAVTLAYGNRAMLFSKTGRSALLDRVGAKEITKRPVTIDIENLKIEKAKMFEWFSKIKF